AVNKAKSTRRKCRSKEPKWCPDSPAFAPFAPLLCVLCGKGFDLAVNHAKISTAKDAKKSAKGRKGPPALSPGQKKRPDSSGLRYEHFTVLTGSEDARPSAPPQSCGHFPPAIWPAAVTPALWLPADPSPPVPSGLPPAQTRRRKFRS